MNTTGLEIITQIGTYITYSHRVITYIQPYHTVVKGRNNKGMHVRNTSRRKREYHNTTTYYSYYSYYYCCYYYYCWYYYGYYYYYYYYYYCYY